MAEKGSPKAVTLNCPDSPAVSSQTGGSDPSRDSLLEAILPAGSFGAGGWAPGTKFAGQYPRLDAEQCVMARKVFRAALIRRYHSVVSAWKDIDKNGDGRISLYEFMRGCQKLGVNVDHGARRFWEALDMDRSGFITLLEVDADLARLLGSLAVCIWSACGSVDEAWKGVFNIQGKMRIDEQEFARGCQEINFPGDPEATFQALRTEKASNGLSRPEFGFLELWFVQKKEKTSPLHDGLEPDPLQRPRRGSSSIPAKPNRAAKPAKQEFKDLLKKSYGNIVRAWRMCLDRDHNGILDWKEFQKACSDVGYAGNRRDLWRELFHDMDTDHSGGITLREIDEPSAHMLEALLRCVYQRYACWEDAWADLMDQRGDDRVKRVEFIQACGVLGYGGNADRLFDLLDMDRVDYLSFDTTSWIEGAERGDKDPKGFTLSQLRLMDSKLRDQRHRRQRFFMRDKYETGVIPASSYLEGSGPLQAGASASLLGMRSDTPSKSHGKKAAQNEDELDALPNWLQSMDKDLKAGKLSKSSSLGGSTRRSRPALSPRSPGHGGWPGCKFRVKDPVWGGYSPTGASEVSVPVSPLSRAAVSEPNLAKWRSGLVPVSP